MSSANLVSCKNFQAQAPISPLNIEFFVTQAKQHRLSLFYMAMAAVLWSTGGVFIKTITLDAYQISFYRSLFAVVTIFAIVKPKHITFDWITVLSGLCYAAMLMLFVMATKLTTAANAILLQYTAPVYVLILGHFFLHEKFRTSDIITMLACIGGMILFFADKVSASGLLGNAFAVLSGVGFGLFTVLLRKKKDDQPIDAILLGNAFVVVLCSGIVMANAKPTDDILGFDISTADSVMVAFLGIFQIGIPYILMTKGVEHLRAIEVSLAAMLEPVLNPLWVALFVGEMPSLNALIGGGIIVAAVTLQGIWADWQRRRTPDAASLRL
jgi:drug/metabolite transporter (DMT)-like permease